MPELERGRCRSCGAAILWGETANGAKMPLDAEPHVNGNIAIRAGVIVVLPKEDLFSERREGEVRYKSHFASCTHPERHRKPRRSN